MLSAAPTMYFRFAALTKSAKPSALKDSFCDTMVPMVRAISNRNTAG